MILETEAKRPWPHDEATEGAGDLDEPSLRLVIGHKRRQAPFFDMVRPLRLRTSRPERLPLDP